MNDILVLRRVQAQHDAAPKDSRRPDLKARAAAKFPNGYLAAR
jgi:hypothetical protein